MLKKSAILMVLLSSCLVTGTAEARLQAIEPSYTVSCSFDDGLGWSITTTDSHYATYYVGVCHGQGGTHEGGIH